MARKAYPATPAMDHDYQAQCDRDTLTRASEIVGDRLRLRAAMASMRAQKRGAETMLSLLGGKRYATRTRR